MIVRMCMGCAIAHNLRMRCAGMQLCAEHVSHSRAQQRLPAHGHICLCQTLHTAPADLAYLLEVVLHVQELLLALVLNVLHSLLELVVVIHDAQALLFNIEVYS